jgi:hypothetical protein
MVLQQGDTHLARVTRHSHSKITTNHSETLLLNVLKKSSSVRNESLHFHEGGFTSVRHLTLHRKTLHNVEVFAPVLLQRIQQVTKVNRITVIFTPC